MSRSLLTAHLTDNHPKTLTTNIHWDVIFTTVQCIFHMTSNEAEGMTVLK